MAPRPTTIFLFRNDLRVRDNAALLAAAKAAGGRVIPLYVFDDKQVGPARSRILGMPKSAPLKTKFLLESVHDLRRQLKSLNSDLVVRCGSTPDVVNELAKAQGVEKIFASAEACPEELTVERKIRAHSLDLKTIWTSTLFALEDLPYTDVGRELPLIYTQFRKTVEEKCTVKPLGPLPVLQEIPSTVDCGEIPIVETLCLCVSQETDSRSVLQFKGGSEAGVERVNDYIFRTDLLKVYKETRNGMVGADYSSKFSPWLSNGSISPREIYWQVKKYEAERVANESTYWLIFELLWRDFFKFLPLRVGSSLFRLEGPRNVAKRWCSGTEAEEGFAAWCSGTTGYALIDANMQELVKSGFMSNRGRQIVASFLTKDLGCDWR